MPEKINIVTSPEPDISVDELVRHAREMFSQQPDMTLMFGFNPDEMQSDGELFASVLTSTLPSGAQRSLVHKLAAEVFARDPEVVGAARADIRATAIKDNDPLGEIGSLLFANGLHALLAYRVSHHLWKTGSRVLAMALKSVFGRALAVDIHPAAELGRGLWIDHGIGVVIGSTSIVEDDVSMWHGVTLGSDLKDRSATRHPRLRKGSTIGAGAVILGGIDIGSGAVVAAGSVVLKEVPPNITVAGVPAKPKNRGGESFKGFHPSSEDAVTK